jgi:hypothetical protein
MNHVQFLIAFGALVLVSPSGIAVPEPVRVSLVQDRAAGAPARYGMQKIKAALEAKGIRCEEPASMQAAHGDFLIVAGVPSKAGPAVDIAKSFGFSLPSAPESLLIRNIDWKGKRTVLLSGADDRGLMYSLLEVADRIGWAADPSNALSEIRDTEESPAVGERGVTIFTMQQAQFEGRFHDENYWARYFDNLARNRFNTFQVLFAYEMDGYMCPAYPYFVDVDEFPDVRVEGLSKAEQQRNLADLHRLIGMAHERGIQVTIGLWCHYHRFTPNFEIVSHDRPEKGKVFGLTEDNLSSYTRAALAKFLRAVPEIDKIMLAMNFETGLKIEDIKGFWEGMFRVMKDAGPNLQYEIRAKGVSDDSIGSALKLGLKIRMNTKYWSEQMGLPFHPTHIQELNQFERRHGYSDLLKYPRDYELHWTLWTSGTTRILQWGDPEYVRRFAGTMQLGGGQGFDIMEPEATKMAGHPHEMKPFDLLNSSYRYYDYEFERYWHYFQVFGRLTYNPNTPSEEWDREFEKRFGKDAATYVEQGLHRASQILPHIVAYCLPPLRFSTTRGWPERQRQEDLPAYAQAEPSDIEQFQSMADAAKNIVEGGASARIAPMKTSRWFAQAASDVFKLAAEAEQHAGANPGKEFLSTMVDLKILANLALYHAWRIPAGMSYALFVQTQDLNALDDAIQNEKRAIQAWGGIVSAAGDVYNSDMMMGLPEYDLSGHWRDELTKLKAGLAALERQRADYRLDARRVIGRYDLGSGPPISGYERAAHNNAAAMFEKNRSNLYTLRVPDGRYEVKVTIKDDAKSHGPMWIEVNGVEYSDMFTVPAGQQVEKTIETSAVDGKLKVLFDNSTSGDWHASTLTVTRIGPLIAHVPVRRVSPGQDLVLRASVTGVAPIFRVRIFYGDRRGGFAVADMERVAPLLYRALIPQSKVVEGLSYFLEAADAAGRLAIWPDGGMAHPVPVLVSTDDEPPVLRHTPVPVARPMQPLRIIAEVEDPSGIQWVRLRYRGLSQHQDFQVLPMLPTGTGNQFQATIPGENIDPKFDLMYLFEVMDNAGNGKIYPDLAKQTPYVVVKVDEGKAGQAAREAMHTTGGRSVQ